MKFTTTLVCLTAAQVSAFAFVNHKSHRPVTSLAAEYEPLEGETKINLKIDLESEKVRTRKDQHIHRIVQGST